MTQPTCKCCGQTLPSPYPEGLKLSPMQARIYEIVRKAGKYGLPIAELVDKVYEHDRNGGPENAYRSTHVQIQLLNARASEFGKRVQARDGQGTHSNYVLVDVKRS